MQRFYFVAFATILIMVWRTTDGVLPDGTIKNEHILPAFVNGQVSLAYKHTTQHILILK